MDIIAKSVLQYIQQQKSHAVIAGGAARDEYLNLTPRDYDIWVQGKYDFMGLISEYDVKDFRQKGEKYDASFHDNGIQEVFAFTVEGKSFDVIAYKDKFFEEDEFAKKVVEGFDFGLNMVYYDGTSIDDSNRNFRTDIDYSSMSLVNMRYMSELPNAVRRYEKFNQKYSIEQKAPQNSWKFEAPCMKLLTEKPVEKLTSYKKMYSGGLAAQNLPPATVPFGWANQADPWGPPATGNVGPAITMDEALNIELDDNF